MNASSESGLCATEISRTGEDTVLIRFLNPVSISFSAKQTRLAPFKTLEEPLISRRDAACRVSRHENKTGQAPSLPGSLSVPACGDNGRHQHLDDFRKNEPLESVLERQRSRVSKHGKPTESTCKEHQFCSHA